MLSSASVKAKLFAENFSKTSNLHDSGIFLPVFPSRTNLKLHNIFATPNIFRKVITNLDLSKLSGPDCLPVVVLKNCQPELSYIPAKLFNKSLNLVGRFHQWFLYLRILGKGLQLKTAALFGDRSTAKNYHPVSLLSVVSKVFERLVNSRVVDRVEKCGPFSDL